MVEIYFYPWKIKVYIKDPNSELCTAFLILALQKHDCFVCKPRNTLCIQKNENTPCIWWIQPLHLKLSVSQTAYMNRNLYLEGKNGRTGNY